MLTCCAFSSLVFSLSLQSISCRKLEISSFISLFSSSLNVVSSCRKLMSVSSITGCFSTLSCFFVASPGSSRLLLLSVQLNLFCGFILPDLGEPLNYVPTLSAIFLEFSMGILSGSYTPKTEWWSLQCCTPITIFL